MKRNNLILFGMAITMLALTALTWTKPTAYQVLATSYTCETTPRNPMHPCGPLRWGGNVNSPGMACPVEWRDRIMEVPGFGPLRCDDTPAQDYLHGLPHIDIRVPTVDQALQIGVQRMIVYAADIVPPAPTPVPPAPTPVPPAPAPAVDQASGNQGLTTTTQEQHTLAPSVGNDFSAQLGEENNTMTKIYTVVANDTLSHIALRYNTTIRHLRALNNLSSNLLIIGQQLRVPIQRGTAAAPAPAPTPVPASESAAQQKVHIVKAGEWIYSIARQYNTSPDIIMRVNNLRNANLLHPGQKLIIP